MKDTLAIDFTCPSCGWKTDKSVCACENCGEPYHQEITCAHKANRNVVSPMLETDFYKTIHHLAYVPKLDYLVSYWTPRMSRIEGVDKVVMFGPQALIIQYLINDFNNNFFNRPWAEVKKEYVRVIAYAMTEQAADTSELKKLHNLGYLPIQIKAVPEGERVNIKTPMFEISNTVKGYGWLVNYLETYISNKIWHPMTAATLAYHLRELSNEYYEKTVDVGSPAAACGDFSMRGLSENAPKLSAGHLLSFTGSATIPAIIWLEDYYNCDCTKEVVGKGVPSTEHSVMSSYGREHEFECYRHLIEDVFPTGPLSIVSDTYDYWNVICNYLPELKDSIMSRDGKIIIRGDSGDPVDIVCGTFGKHSGEIIEELNISYSQLEDYFKERGNKDFLWQEERSRLYLVRVEGRTYKVTCTYTFIEDNESSMGGYTCDEVNDVTIEDFVMTPEMKGTVELLWEIFGGTINSKGYKVLDSHIGAIYGDGITYERAKQIFERLEKKGFAASNCTLGIGSYTYQYVTRDTFGFALKATNAVVDGKERIIYKDPITDKIAGNNFKKSQKGMCYVYRDGNDILYTDEHTIAEMEGEKYADNLLQPVFRDGKLLREFSLSEIRNRLHRGNF